MISTLAIDDSVSGAAVLTSRSTDGGLTWRNPVTTSLSTGHLLRQELDHLRHVGAEPALRQLLPGVGRQRGDPTMSTSTDGGLTWGPKDPRAGSGVGGQPVVQPNGNVVVPYEGGAGIRSFRSIDGGASWQASVAVANVSEHGVAGNLRTSPLPSAEVDERARSTSPGRTAASARAAPRTTSSTAPRRTGSRGRPKRGSRSTRRQRRRPFHPGYRGRPLDLREHARGSRSATTTTRSPPAARRTCQLHVGFVVVDRRRRDVDAAAQGRRADQPRLDREHEPGRDGRRLHVDLLRRRQLRVPGLRGRQSARRAPSSTSGCTARGSTSRSRRGRSCARATIRIRFTKHNLVPDLELPPVPN